MSNTIYKPDRDKDFYVLWSNNTDFPIMWGKAKAFSRWSCKAKYMNIIGDFEQRKNRADLTSSSSHLDWEHTWDEDLTIDYIGFGYIFRSEIHALLKVLKKRRIAKDDPRVLYLVYPYERDDAVNGNCDGCTNRKK